MNLTPHQHLAFSAIEKFLKSPTASKVFVLSGYAGTGKTTLISSLPPKDLAFCAPTGKAAQVLQSKGINATTIHRLIYEVIPNTSPPRFKKRTSLSCKAIVCDEASMVSADILKDLLSFNKPILFVGDPFQLPPVGIDPGLFTQFPSASLTEVHRQALDNPIISLATYLRTDPRPNVRVWHSANAKQDKVRLMSRNGVRIDPTSIDQVIVGTNRTRISVNTAIRRRLGRTSLRPQTGEKLIILKNNYALGLTNGQQVTALEDASLYDNQLLVADDSGNEIDIEFLPEIFDRSDETNIKTCPSDFIPITYAYAITCHKSQGSEFPHVAVIDEAFGKDNEPTRWRYTAVTRAKEQLTYFI